MTEETRAEALRASVALLTARLHGEPIADVLVEEWALSPDLEPVRLALGDTLLRAGLTCLADAVERELPGSRRGSRWRPDAADRYTALLYAAFARVPPPLGEALVEYDGTDDTGVGVRDVVVAGELHTDYPAAVNAALQQPPDGPFRALVIEAHYLGFGARPDDRYAWLDSAVTVTLAQLCQASDALGVDPAEQLSRWGLRAA